MKKSSEFVLLMKNSSIQKLINSFINDHFALVFTYLNKAPSNFELVTPSFGRVQYNKSWKKIQNFTGYGDPVSFSGTIVEKAI